MSETVQSWMERATAGPGVLACGVRFADRSCLARTCREEFSEPQVTQALRDVSEAVYALQQNRLSADHLRWTFENGVIRCITKPGGVLAALLLSPETADAPEIEQLLGDFVLTVA